MSRPAASPHQSATITVPCDPSPPPAGPYVTAGHEQFAIDLAITKSDLKGMGDDVHEQGRKIDNLESEVRNGFQRVTADMSRGFSAFSQELNSARQPKGIAWPMVSVFMVLTLALASWANSYFGQGIAAATKEAQMASDKWEALNSRMDLISTRQHGDAVTSARAEGFQTAWSQGAEKEKARIRIELDRLTQARQSQP